MKKGKKSGIKNQNNNTLARYKTLWVKENEDPAKCLIIKKPEPPQFQLKESARAFKDSMSELYGTDKHELDVSADTEPPVKKKKLSKAEKKALRKKADVIPIGSKSLGKTGRSENSTHKQWEAERDERLRMAAALEEHIAKDAANSSEVAATKLHSVTNTPEKDEATGKATHSGYGFATKSTSNVTQLPVKSTSDDVPEDWYKTYGTKVIDTGRGMTPSGRPITDFLEGGPFAPPKKESELHSVTETANKEEWSYEELATKYDDLQLELYKLKEDYERRLGTRDERITAMEKVLFDLRQAERVEQFNTSHTQNFEVAVIELQEENSYLTKENEELREELAQLMDDVDRGFIASTNSKPPLKTLANQFELFKVQVRDNPLQTFCNRMGVDQETQGRLRLHFDREFQRREELREKVFPERMVYKRWAWRREDNPVYVKPRKAVRLRQEIKGLRRIKNNVANTASYGWDLAKERLVYKRWANRTTKPMCSKRMEYYQWWMDNLTPEEAHLRALRTTTTAKIIKPILSAVRAVDKVLNYELSPTKRREEKNRHIAKRNAKRNAIKKQKEEASRIKREQEKKFERELELERIREAQRIAH